MKEGNDEKGKRKERKREGKLKLRKERRMEENELSEKEGKRRG